MMHSGVDPGGDGGIYPPQYLTRGGMAYVIIPPQCYAYLIDDRHALNILTAKLDSQQLLCHLFCIACSSLSKWTHNLFYLKVKRMIVWIKLKKPTVQEAASGNDTLTGNCVHKTADFLLSTIYPWKTGSFYASISRWVITYSFDINVKICNVLICLELIKMLPKSIHQIAPFSFQNSKIFQLLRGAHPPSDTPLCAQARNWRWRATRSSPPQYSQRIYAPDDACGYSLWFSVLNNWFFMGENSLVKIIIVYTKNDK